ncbi:MAG TPA: hypothetical protein VGL66_17140 [Caulobacteraceae bacterium]|jgi:hypothetical protein
MNKNALIFATLIGTAAQVAMVVIGHFVPAVRQFYMWGGLGLSLVAGALYAWKACGGWGGALIGGLIAGGVCAVMGIAVSWLLKDVPVSLIALGGGSSAVTGLVGGAIGKLVARPAAATA